LNGHGKNDGDLKYLYTKKWSITDDTFIFRFT